MAIRRFRLAPVKTLYKAISRKSGQARPSDLNAPKSQKHCDLMVLISIASNCDFLILRSESEIALSLDPWGPVPVPLRVGAPGKPLLRVSVETGSCLRRGASCLRYCKGTCNGQCPVCHPVLSLLQPSRVGQVTGQPLWGHSFLLASFLALRYGGGSLGGEAIGLSVPRSLITTLQKVGAAHGPRHPAYSSQSCDVYSCFLSDPVNCLFLKKGLLL